VFAVRRVGLADWTQVFKVYFNELEEESVRDNFIIIYESVYIFNLKLVLLSRPHAASHRPPSKVSALENAAQSLRNVDASASAFAQSLQH
jgi:hypothetical protein